MTYQQTETAGGLDLTACACQHCLGPGLLLTVSAVLSLQPCSPYFPLVCCGQHHDFAPPHLLYYKKH